MQAERGRATARPIQLERCAEVLNQSARKKTTITPETAVTHDLYRSEVHCFTI